MCWNVAKSNDRDLITLDDVREAFHHLQIDELGLDSLDRSYLKTLLECGTLPLNVLNSKLSLPALTLQRVVELYLLKEGFIMKDRMFNTRQSFNSTRIISDFSEKVINVCHIEIYDAGRVPGETQYFAF